MPSTRSRAATKCISEVPGLAKQTSTPPATSVRTRLSAPFIVPLPFATFLERTKMTRGFAFLVAAVTLLAGIDHARAQGFDMRDVMGGGSFFGFGSRSSSGRREVVSFVSQYKPGTIYIDTAERRLYLVLAQGQALRYGIGVGRDGFRWSGVHRISAKKEWPGWTPPSQMLARRPDLPRHMAGGLDNPLGARAMYLGSTLYRIHGSNEPDTIGQAVSSGCFRMSHADVNHPSNRATIR